jgi:hypothetical protein
MRIFCFIEGTDYSHKKAQKAQKGLAEMLILLRLWCLFVAHLSYRFGVGVGLGLGVGLGVGSPGDGLGITVGDGRGLGLPLGVGDGLGIGLGLGIGIGLGEGLCTGTAAGLATSVPVAVGVFRPFATFFPITNEHCFVAPATGDRVNLFPLFFARSEIIVEGALGSAPFTWSATAV